MFFGSNKIIKKIFVFGGICIVIFAFSVGVEPTFTIPKNWPKPVYNFEANLLSKEKTLLGRALFYDPILSIDSTISCMSCHLQYTAFTHVDHNLSHGINDRIGTRKAPALTNLAWQPIFMWDGAINNLDMQSLAPISHPNEMGENIGNMVKKLNHSTIYKKLFYNAFKDSIATGQNTLLAIGQFMAILVSANCKYDKVRLNQDTFSVQEKNN